MLSEKDMENAIAENPNRYLGEEGLELIERQYRIGGYIFDLLFKDRHGAKLIVEIQKGTLDRVHTYKILDYYDGFKEKHPDEFIELMVIANQVPEERKKRLRSWGVEFREIPLSDFISDSPSDILISPNKQTTTASVKAVKVLSGDSVPIDYVTRKSYELFKEQKNRFVEELLRVDKDMTLRVNWVELSDDNINKHTNWFIGFVPKKWGVFKAGWFGIHFGFASHRDRKTGLQSVRFNVGVEKPLKAEFRDEFKKDVVNSLKRRNINLPGCAIWPDVGFRGAKLIETELVELESDSWQKVLNRYQSMGEFVQVVEDVIKEYYNRGCFSAHLDFPD
jgi:hypothetical protein